MKILSVLLAVVLGAMISASAQASQSFRLNLNNHFNGQNMVGLKQELKAQHGVDVTGYNIVSVRVIAKSRQGAGKVTLIANGGDQDTARIGGRPIDFNDTSASSFDRVLLTNSSVSRPGVWRLRFQGNIKVRAVVVEIQRNQPVASLRTVIVGNTRVDKFIQTRRTYSVNERRVARVVLEGTRKTVRIIEALVTYGNGQIERMYDLEGRIEDGERRRFPVGGRNVRSISITATSPNLIGSRGEYQLSVIAR